MECSDWKIRLESIETVNKILEEANKRIQSSGTVELFGSLRNCLHDNNKNLNMATLSTIGGLASAMGPEVEKSSKNYNATVEFYWAPFFVESNSDDPNMHNILNRVIMPESIKKHWKNWKNVLQP